MARRGRPCAVGIGLVAAVVAWPASSSAQSAERTGFGAWSFTAAAGAGGAGGEYGDFLEKPVTFDLHLAKGRGRWRFGGGIQLGSLVLKPPYDDQEDWSQLEVYGSATRVFNPAGRVRPYLQARLGLVRVHPRSTIFHVIPPEDFARGENPTEAVNGFGAALLPGVELELTKSLALDVSASFSTFRTAELDLAPIGRTTAKAGRQWGLRGGLTWRPLAEGVEERPATALDPATGQLARLPPADAERDAWGVPRSWGWAATQALGINFVATTLNEYVRGESSYPVTPRTFRENIERGFKFDDNEFKTNQLIHPFNGATYFNSARGNGIGFWGSSAMALAGAFLWECCGESQPMSWNDMLSTGLGGISRGEVAYRLGSLIRDNTKSGSRRVWRELAAGPFDPIGTFNRFVSGRATRVQGNPESPYDWRPPQLLMTLSVGARVIGEGKSISENTNTYGLVELDLAYGSPFQNERRRPFDRFDTVMQLNLGDKSRAGRIQIRGDLWSKPLGHEAADGAPPKHVLTVAQDFDYIDNEAYEYGGQGVGLALFSRFGTGRTVLTTRATGYLVAGAAVNADYSYLAEIPDARELRDYDYGAGVGAGFEALLTRSRRPLAVLGYRYTLIDVRNGSLYNPSDGQLPGSDAKHQVHRVLLRLTLPLGRRLGIGADYWLFYRDSRYDAPELQDKTQRNPEARVYLVWNMGH